LFCLGAFFLFCFLLGLFGERAMATWGAREPSQ
jgi:hypothetical protein